MAHVDFLDNLRENFQVVILSDTFHEIASPLMEKLGFPLLLCHTLNVKDGMILLISLGKKKLNKKPLSHFRV